MSAHDELTVDLITEGDSWFRALVRWVGDQFTDAVTEGAGLGVFSGSTRAWIQVRHRLTNALVLEWDYGHDLPAAEFAKGEIEKCVLFAPQDGLVVYYVPEQTRMGGGSRQSIIAQGEPVMEGQKLIRIPDLSKMVVNTKVHEAMVSRLQAGQKAVARVDAFPERTLRAHIKSVATVASQQDWFRPVTVGASWAQRSNHSH